MTVTQVNDEILWLWAEAYSLGMDPLSRFQARCKARKLERLLKFRVVR